MTLAGRIAAAGVIESLATLALRALLSALWSIENARMQGDLAPLSDWHATLSIVALCLTAPAMVGITVHWLWCEAWLSRTRYAIADRRVMQLRRRRSGTAISCLSRAAEAQPFRPASDGSLAVDVSPAIGTAAPGTLIAQESLALQRLGPAQDAALAALGSPRQLCQDRTCGTDAWPEARIWSGQAIQGVIWDAGLLGRVGAIPVLSGPFLAGVWMMLAGLSGLLFLDRPDALTDRGRK